MEEKANGFAKSPQSRQDHQLNFFFFSTTKEHFENLSEGYKIYKSLPGLLVFQRIKYPQLKDCPRDSQLPFKLRFSTNYSFF